MIINLRTENDSAVLARIGELYAESLPIFDDSRRVGTAYFPTDDGRPLFVLTDNDVSMAERAVANGYNVVMTGDVPADELATEVMVVTNSDDQFPFPSLNCDDLAAVADLLEEQLGL